MSTEMGWKAGGGATNYMLLFDRCYTSGFFWISSATYVVNKHHTLGVYFTYSRINCMNAYARVPVWNTRYFSQEFLAKFLCIKLEVWFYALKSRRIHTLQPAQLHEADKYLNSSSTSFSVRHWMLHHVPFQPPIHLYITHPPGMLLKQRGGSQHGCGQFL